jgi:hypothetical protein
VNIKKLFVGWQSPKSRTWHTVGVLSYSDERQMFQFQYTKGHLDCKDEFPYMSGMDNPNKTYYSKELFAFAKNRLLSKNRPEYKEFMSWLKTESMDLGPLEELAFSGGVKGTDSLEFFSVPQIENGRFIFNFFVRGIRHLSDISIERIKKLNEEEKIYLMTDPQNASDRNAVAIRTEKPAILIGYCPKHLTKDFCALLRNNEFSSSVEAKIVRVNYSAPLQYRIAIELSAEWPLGHQPFADDQFKSQSNAV